MKPTPEQFLLGMPYEALGLRYRFIRSRPFGVPKVEVRSAQSGVLLNHPVVRTSELALYLSRLP